MNKLVDVTFIACIFLSLTSIPLGFVDFYLYYIIVIVCFPLLLWHYQSLDKWVFILFVYIFIIGITNVALGNNSLSQFLKIYIGASVFYMLFYYIIKHRNYNLSYLYSLYYKFAVLHAYIGLIQFLSYLIGFNYGYDFSWFGMRTMNPENLVFFTTIPIYGLTSEPAGFVIVQSGALLYAIERVSKSSQNITIVPKFEAILILSTVVLSLSSTGYFALFIALLFHYRNDLNLKKLILGIISLFLLFTSLYGFVEKFRSRLNTLVFLILGSSYLSSDSTENSAGSSVILFNHFLIALENAKNHILGTGLGSHHLAFERYNTLKTWFTGYGPYSLILNLNDASSLFNRILSELGFAGIIFVIFFLNKFYIRKSNSDYTLLNHTSLVVILTHLLRGGHYFLFGLPFFVLCYYYSSNFSKSAEF